MFNLVPMSVRQAYYSKYKGLPEILLVIQAVTEIKINIWVCIVKYWRKNIYQLALDISEIGYVIIVDIPKVFTNQLLRHVRNYCGERH